MSKVRIEDVFLSEESEIVDDALEQGFEKFSHIKRTKMKNEENRYKNKKENKGRERNKKNK